MKRIMSWTFVGVFFASILTSCASSKGNCDAYSFNNTEIQQNNVATNQNTTSQDDLAQR